MIFLPLDLAVPVIEGRLALIAKALVDPRTVVLNTTLFQVLSRYPNT